MKLFRIGFVAAVAMAFAGQAMAADAPKIDPAKRTQGMKEAPAVIQQLGLNCPVSDAQFIGNSVEKVDGKDVKDSLYEVACTGGLGYIVVSKPGGKGDHYDCMTMRAISDRGKAAAAAKAKAGDGGGGGRGGGAAAPAAGSSPVCTLPANADAKQGLAPLLVKANAPCTLSDARLVGSIQAQAITLFETSCSEGRGYLLTVPDVGSTKPLSAIDCAEASLYGLKCELTSEAQISQDIIQKSKPINPAACQATTGRWVVTSATGDRYYEIACADGKSGYIFQADAKGTPKTLIACGKAQQIAGGCTLTNFDVAQTQEAGLYTTLAKQIGFPCNVSKYQTLGQENAPTQREVVELVCKESPAGVWALLPTGSGGAGTVYNCLRATTVGLNCKLTPMPATYAAIGAQIAAKGKTCQVTNARVIPGVVSQQGGDFIEVACGGGGGGMVVAYAPTPIESVSDVFTCKEAAGTTRACKLG